MSCPDCIMNPDGPCAKCSDSLAELIERKYPSEPVHGKTITMKCRHCETSYCQHEWVPVEPTEIERGFTFLPESKTWVYRESGRQSHLLPDGRMVDVVEE